MTQEPTIATPLLPTRAMGGSEANANANSIASQIQSRIVQPAKRYHDTHKYQSFEVDMTMANTVLGDIRKNEIGLILPNNNRPAIEMMSLDSVLYGNVQNNDLNLYDLASAQLVVETYYAQQLQKQHQHFSANRISYLNLPGLKFSVYNAPMSADGSWDVNYFARHRKTNLPMLGSGFSDNFSTLETALHYFKASGTYYAEWFGYVYPPQSGRYRFKSTGASRMYVWLENDALTHYSMDNALPSSDTYDDVYLTKGTFYPIRIHFGFNATENLPGDFLTILFNGQVLDTGANGQGLFHFLTENTLRKAPYEPIQIHYSLIEEDPKTARAVTTPSADTPKRFHVYMTQFKLANNYTYNEKLRGARSYENIEMSSVILAQMNTTSSTATDPPILLVDANGGVVFKNTANQVKLGALPSNINLAKAVFKLDAGDLFVTVDQTNVWSLLNDSNIGNKDLIRSNYSQCVMSQLWSNRYISAFNNGVVASQTKQLKEGDNPLYSADGKVMLSIVNGALTLSTKSVQSGSGNGEPFLTSDVSNRNKYFLLSTNSDMKLGMTMVADTSSQKLQYIPMGGNLLSYTDTYTPSSGNYSYPPNVTRENARYRHILNMDQPACEYECNHDPKCSHYYNYTTAEDMKHCIVDKNNDAPLYLPENPNLGVKRATDGKNNAFLYQRKKQINTKCMINTYDVNYQTTIQSDGYLTYDKYSVDLTPYDPSSNREGPCGDPEIANSLSIFNTGKTLKPGHEGFAAGYNPTPCQSLSGPDCMNDIQNNIHAINEASRQREDNNAEIKKKYNDMTNTLFTQFVPKYNQINGNKEYDAIGPDGRLANDNKSRRFLLNGMIEDVKDTMIQQNTYYILANMCVATLLIAFFAFAPE